MATIQFDPALLGAMLQLGTGARIINATWLRGRFGDMLEFEIHGPDVPVCDRAELVFTQTIDATQPCVVLTAVIKPIED